MIIEIDKGEGMVCLLRQIFTFKDLYKLNKYSKLKIQKELNGLSFILFFKFLILGKEYCISSKIVGIV